MPDQPAKPAERKLKRVGQELEAVRVEMDTWLALKARAGSYAFIQREAGKVLDEWAANQLVVAEEPKKPGRGGKRPGAGRPRKSKPE